MSDFQNLFKRELIFTSDANTKDEIFEEVGQYLIEKEYVKNNFIDGVKEREKNYPTGLDLSPIGENVNNVAIPHTEVEYCLSKAIGFVKLESEIEFYNMIKPEEALDAKYLFFIINNEKNGQTEVLSDLMDFLTKEENIKKLDEINNEDTLFKFLTNN